MFDKDLFGDDIKPDAQGSILAATWEYPPFSVLNAREGWWQERKRQWMALGIKSELGRGGGVTWGVTPNRQPTRKPSTRATAFQLGKRTNDNG